MTNDEALSLLDKVGRRVNRWMGYSSFFDLPSGEKKGLLRLASLVQEKRLDEEILFSYFDALASWYSEGVGDKILLARRDIFAALVPPPKIPAALYRGLAGLKDAPQKGQRIVYSSARPFVHFTDNEIVARDFANAMDYSTGPEDQKLVLKVKKPEIDKQIIFLWPNDHAHLLRHLGISDSYPEEREWGIFIQQPMLVHSWYQVQKKSNK